jgi:alpha-amylase
VYQPKDYRVVRSHLGRKADLLQAMDALKKAGVRCYVDVVFNHMANENREDRFQFPGKTVLERYAGEAAEFEKDRLYGDLSKGLFDEHDFHPCRDIEDWSDDHQLLDRELSGLPDLVLSIAVVREQIRCLEALVAQGFDGFRVDAVKHLPMDHVRDVFQSRPMQGKFVFGETLTFDDRQNDDFLWPVIRSTSMSCYDFPLQQTLVQAFRPGGTLRDLVDPAPKGNALPWNRGVTFTVTHDVPNNDGFRGMLLDPHDEHLAYAFVLGRDGGVPLVYSDHGESARKYPSDRGRWDGCWGRYDIAQMIRFHNAVHAQDQRTLWKTTAASPSREATRASWRSTRPPTGLTLKSPPGGCAGARTAARSTSMSWMSRGRGSASPCRRATRRCGCSRGRPGPSAFPIAAIGTSDFESEPCPHNFLLVT